MEAETIAHKLVEEYGVPLEIHSDQGRKFANAMFAETCRLLGIKQTHTTTYNPSSNDCTERMNKVLLAMMAIFCKNVQNRWDRYLPIA